MKKDSGRLIDLLRMKVNLENISTSAKFRADRIDEVLSEIIEMIRDKKDNELKISKAIKFQLSQARDLIESFK